MEWRRMIYQGRDLGDSYMVSDHGDIKNSKTGAVRKLSVNHNGYLFCSISLGSRTDKMSVRVHRAVAETFIDNPEYKPEVNHIDGDKTNNRADNLEWVTGSENVAHAYKYGLCKASKCESNGLSKLTQPDVEWARSVYKPRDKEFGLRKLAEHLGVSHVTLRAAIMCKTWV